MLPHTMSMLQLEDFWRTLKVMRRRGGLWFNYGASRRRIHRLVRRCSWLQDFDCFFDALKKWRQVALVGHKPKLEDTFQSPIIH